MKEELIAPCGMNCKLCVAYQSMDKDLNSKGFNKKYCKGCIPRGKNCVHMADSCETIGHGLVRFCYECNKFPCTRLKSLDRRYHTKYHMSMIENLKAIQESGMETFLRAQEEKWGCPNCNDTICCHNGLCLNCQLDTLKENKKYHWDKEER